MMTDLLFELLSLYGLKEVDGKESNPEIIKMGKELGFDIADDSTTAWCSLTINYVAKKCGYERTNKLDARSWLQMPIRVLKPSVGDVVVLWRESPESWKGHVGLYIRMDEKNIWLLSGNQNNEINISPYPRERLLGIRKLKRIQP
jgi:uncharacterized protein (TIGR02594 family)